MNGKQPTVTARALPADTRKSTGYFGRSVGAFVPKVVAAAFEKFGFHTAEIMTSWATIVGEDLARITQPEAIKWPRGSKSRAAADDEDARTAGATLVVATDPAFALEVSYRTRDIVDRINRYFGYRAIAQLRVVQVPRTGSGHDQPHPASVRIAPASAPQTASGLDGALDALAANIRAAAAR